MTIPAAALPDWVEVGMRLCYVSKSNANVTHHVKVKQIEERKQTVLVVFEMDKKVWKRVPFSEISRVGEGSLRPLWKPEPIMSTVPERPANFEREEGDKADDDAEVMSVQGPPTAAEAASESAASQPDDPGDEVSVVTPVSASASASTAVASIDDDSEEERQAQMARRMKRMEKARMTQGSKSRSRSPKKKSYICVPGHMA